MQDAGFGRGTASNLKALAEEEAWREDLGGAFPAVKERRDPKATSSVTRRLIQLCLPETGTEEGPKAAIGPKLKPKQDQLSPVTTKESLLLGQGNTSKMGTLLCMNG